MSILAPTIGAHAEKTLIEFDKNHSTIGFAVPILGGISRVTGKFMEFDIELRYDDQNIENSSVRVVISAKSVDTGIAQRDGHLRTPDFFHVSKFPEIVFESTAIKAAAEDYIVEGRLTLHGVTKDVALPMRLLGPFSLPDSSGRVWGIEIRMTIDREEFGMKYRHESLATFVGTEIEVLINLITKGTEARAPQ